MTMAVRPDHNNNALAIAPPSQDQAIARLVEWAQAANAAYEVATKLCGTQFAPVAYRGKPEEATAAILAGAEVGLSPMAALRAFDNIQGTPAPKAITLRAITQAHGHKIRIDESTPTKAVVSGLTKGDTVWQTSTWTIERAREMGLTGKDQWKKQPAAMLIARATAEVCRWIAADAIMGMPYSAEEIYDSEGSFEARPAARRVTAAEILASKPISAQPANDADEPPADEAAAPAPMEDNRSRAMFALFREAAQFEQALTTKEGQLAYIAHVIGREIESRKEITAAEGEAIIESLRGFIGEQEPQGGGQS
jgi:hypothetical protein